MQVAVFHPGTQHSWQTALALQQLGRLEWYATSIFYKADRMPYLLERLPGGLGRKLSREFSRFYHPGLDPELVRTTGVAEWIERVAARIGLRRLAQKVDTMGNRRFAANIAQQIASPKKFALWGYNASSLAAFRQGRAAGRKLILDRTIGDFRHYNQLMDAVAASHSSWFLPVDRRFPPHLIDRDQHEYELADTIVCGSEFCAQTVRDRGGPSIAGKVRVLPYCFDEALFAGTPTPVPLKPDEPLRFLFVGQLSPRKGIHHLLEAFARIPKDAARLTLVGEMRVPHRTFAPFADRVDYLPTVPRADIPAIMADHHILVFPSYFEGSSLSLIEALACGMGVIQTHAAGNGATGQTGLILHEPSTEALFAAMMEAIDDRAMVEGWRANAQNDAARYSFAAYRENIAQLLVDQAL